MQTATHYKPFLVSCSWFRQLDADLQTSIVEAAELRDYARNECVFATGDVCDGLSVIVEGSVRVTQQVNGKDALLGIFAAPFWVGEVSIIDGNPRQHNVFADQKLRVVHVPMPAIEALLARRPDFYRYLGILVSSKLRLAICALQDSAVESTPVRIARRLLIMASAYGAWTDRTALNLQVSQEQLAAMLGTSRQTVSVILRDLEARGTIRIAYGRIELLDVDALRQLANAHEEATPAPHPRSGRTPTSPGATAASASSAASSATTAAPATPSADGTSAARHATSAPIARTQSAA